MAGESYDDDKVSFGLSFCYGDIDLIQLRG